MPQRMDERERGLERRGLRRLALVEVSGPSMTPTVNTGDTLIVRYGARVRPGDVVLLRHPLQQDLLIVKRVVERRDGGWWVVSDNALAAFANDSRDFGAVPDELVLARGLLRLRPPADVAAQRTVRSAVSWAAVAVRPLSRRLRAR
ncbi:nickel-type superoxide dismutase maturation protease [Streptomyces sp. NPDC051940]|uniref:nickel-type superoxide dismutase maturation protease n=1 Tax=Streptomyces sp. NPDC051940 TaxID=3155675 RepID=UPI003429C7B7